MNNAEAVAISAKTDIVSLSTAKSFPISAPSSFKGCERQTLFHGTRSCCTKAAMMAIRFPLVPWAMRIASSGRPWQMPAVESC